MDKNSHPIERVFPPDPDLDEPEVDTLFTQTPEPAEHIQGVENSLSPLAPQRHAPVISPAEPVQWQTTVALSRPLIVDGNRLDEITVKCLTGEQFVKIVMAYGANETTLMPEVRAAMCGHHPAVISALAADDQARVVAACRPFYPLPLQGDPDETDIVAASLAELHARSA